MSEPTKSELVELVRIVQDDYDDGVQEIVLHFSNGRTVAQKWEWPDLKFRGQATADSAYILYEKAREAELDVNIVYGIITTTAKLVEGEPLQIADESEEEEETEDDEQRQSEE